MKIDQVGQNIIKLALYVDSTFPGYVSEIWIEDEDIENYRAAKYSKEDINKLISKTREQIHALVDIRRKEYLSEILQSIVFFIENQNSNYAEFSKNTLGFEITRVSAHEIEQIQKNIKNLEKDLNSSRQEVCLKQKVNREDISRLFNRYSDQAKEVLPNYVLDFPDKGFETENVTDKPWSAFNSHISPFKSKLSFNTDVGLVDADLHHLAYHEAYGGHHSELSNKDKLLMKGRGEHGLVITYSPQVFVSEAIAEGVYEIFSDQKDNKEYQMVMLYNRLTFALQNLATHLFLEDKFTRGEINEYLIKFAVSDNTRKNILNFSTDKVFGRYAPVYYSALDFFIDLYSKSTDKNKLLKTLFTLPCTPKMLENEFSPNGVEPN